MSYILFVDAEPQIRRLGSFWLQQAGHPVKGAASAAEALELVRDEMPDAVIAAAALPDHDGSWLVTRVRELAPRMPIVIILSYADQIADLESVSYLVQPFSNDTLADALDHAQESLPPLAHPDRRQTPLCPNCGRPNIRRIPETSQEPQLRWFKCLSCRHIWKKGPRGPARQT